MPVKRANTTKDPEAKKKSKYIDDEAGEAEGSDSEGETTQEVGVDDGDSVGEESEQFGASTLEEGEVVISYDENTVPRDSFLLVNPAWDKERVDKYDGVPVKGTCVVWDGYKKAYWFVAKTDLEDDESGKPIWLKMHSIPSDKDIDKFFAKNAKNQPQVVKPPPPKAAKKAAEVAARKKAVVPKKK